MGPSLLKFGRLEGDVRRLVMFFVQPVALINDLERSAGNTAASVE